MDPGFSIDRVPRASVMLTAHVFRIGETEASQHRILNISSLGVCIAQAPRLEAGCTVSIAIGQVESVVAEVVWKRGDCAGLRFHRTIDITTPELRRSGGNAPPSAGWIADLRHAHRRG